MQTAHALSLATYPFLLLLLQPTTRLFLMKALRLGLSFQAHRLTKELDAQNHLAELRVDRPACVVRHRRIQGRLELLEKEDPPVEYRFRLEDPWSRKLFTALCRRYDVRTYRYRGQKRSSIMAKMSRRFVDETLWPEYEQLSKVLRSYLDDITERVIAEAIHTDMSDATEVEAPRGLPARIDK